MRETFQTKDSSFRSTQPYGKVSQIAHCQTSLLEKLGIQSFWKAHSIDKLPGRLLGICVSMNLSNSQKVGEQVRAFWKHVPSENRFLSEGCSFQKWISSGNTFLPETCSRQKWVSSGNAYLSVTQLTWKHVPFGNKFLLEHMFLLEIDFFWK